MQKCACLPSKWAVGGLCLPFEAGLPASGPADFRGQPIVQFQTSLSLVGKRDFATARLRMGWLWVSFVGMP